MSIRTNLSLALAIALIAAGTSYGQQSGVGATEDQQQLNNNAQQQSETLESQQRSDQARQDQARQPQQRKPGERIERRAGFRGTTAQGERGRTARLSEIMALDVHNAQDEDLGDINDIVIDVDSGKIRYVAVSVGGFLGIGDRLVAVPWESFRHQRDEEGDRFLVLNIDRQRLENAPGFNDDNWPDFGSEQYNTEINRYYGNEAGTTRDTTIRTRTDRTTTPATQNRDEPQSQPLPQ